MIKPKYKKGMDFSQIARSAVEHAINEPLFPNSPPKKKPSSAPKKKVSAK
jgi:hypothetical protein